MRIEKKKKSSNQRRSLFSLYFSIIPKKIALFGPYGKFHLKMLPVWTRLQFVDSSKLKGFADNNFKFYENGRQLKDWVENTVGKGEIARYEQFLLFPQCFQKTCTADT